MKILSRIDFTNLWIKKNRLEGFDKKRCRRSIYLHGEPIAVFDAGPKVMDRLCKEASNKDITFDWHYCGGRAVVKTLDDPVEAAHVLSKAFPKLLRWVVDPMGYLFRGESENN